MAPIPISGQKTVPTAGTAVSLGSQMVNGPILIKALETNTGIIAVGNDGLGDVTPANGLRLAAGEEVEMRWVGNLSSLWLDAAVNGEGISYLILSA